MDYKRQRPIGHHTIKHEPGKQRSRGLPLVFFVMTVGIIFAVLTLMPRS